MLAIGRPDRRLRRHDAACELARLSRRDVHEPDVVVPVVGLVGDERDRLAVRRPHRPESRLVFRHRGLRQLPRRGAAIGGDDPDVVLPAPGRAERDPLPVGRNRRRAFVRLVFRDLRGCSGVDRNRPQVALARREHLLAIREPGRDRSLEPGTRLSGAIHGLQAQPVLAADRDPLAVWRDRYAAAAKSAATSTAAHRLERQRPLGRRLLFGTRGRTRGRCG